MKEQKPSNPNAFPTRTEHESPTDIEVSGMTLRDYFSNSVDGAKISEGYSLAFVEEVLGRKKPDDKIEIIKFWFEFESILQYLKADEMLKQRELCV